MLNLKHWNDPSILALCRNPTIDAFPAMKALFMSDDFTAGALSWASRYGGLTLTLPNTNTVKDADGVGSSAACQPTAVSGTMPTVGSYVVFTSTGHLGANVYIGIGFTLGDTTSGVGVGSQGIAKTAGASVAVPALSGVTTHTIPASIVSYFDCVDTSSPALYTALANDTDNVLDSGSGALTGTDLTDMGDTALTAAANCGALAGTANRRVKIIGLFDFANPLTLNELKLAAGWQAHNTDAICPLFLERAGA